MPQADYSFDINGGGVEAEVGGAGTTVTSNPSSYSLEGNKKEDFTDATKPATTGPAGGEKAADGAGAGGNDQGGADGGVEGKPSEGTAKAEPNDEALKSPEAFNKEDPENLKAWDAEYRREDGSLNMERFQKSVTANMLKEGGKAELSDNEYAYLGTLGFSKDDVDTYIGDRLKALEHTKTQDLTASQKADAALFDHVHKLGQEVGASIDGPDLLKAAVEWASSVYTKEQQARYNKTMNGKDQDAKLEAAETLVTRFSRSDVFIEGEKALRLSKLPTEARRDATREGTVRGTPGDSTTYPMGAEGRAAWAADRKAAGDDREALRRFAEKAARSGL